MCGMVMRESDPEAISDAIKQVGYVLYVWMHIQPNFPCLKVGWCYLMLGREGEDGLVQAANANGSAVS